MGVEIISLREFARRLEVGEKTIRDGIKTGKISDGVVLVKGKSKISYHIALKEAQDNGLGHRSLISKGIDPVVSAPSSIKNKAKSSPAAGSDNEQESFDNDLDENTSFKDATRKEKVARARIACMEADAKAGTLVNKSEVYSQLFEFGSQIRSEFESMPGRISSKLAILTDPSQVAEYLAKEIRSSLGKLIDDLSERKIN